MLDDFSSDYCEENASPNIQTTRRRKERRKRTLERPKVAQRKVVNFPATQPYVRLVDGEERLCFKYNTRVSETALSTMPQSHLEDYEFCVRFDIDSVDCSRLSAKFKSDNCIYPRANCEASQYKGNRWAYETECNQLAWQFVSLNPVLLYGKKGLIQRAVDTYRNSVKESRRKVLAELKLPNTHRKRLSDQATTAVIFYAVKGTVKRVRINIDIQACHTDPEFSARYSVFPEHYDINDFGKARLETKNPDNELSARLAMANAENQSFWNAVRATDKAFMLRKAVQAYKEANQHEDSDETEFQQIVESTVNEKDEFSFLRD